MYVTMDILSSIGLSQINTIWYCCKLFPNVKKKKKKKRLNQMKRTQMFSLDSPRTSRSSNIFPFIRFLSSPSLLRAREVGRQILVFEMKHIYYDSCERGSDLKWNFRIFIGLDVGILGVSFSQLRAILSETVYTYRKVFFCFFFLRKPDLTRGRGKKS